MKFLKNSILLFALLIVVPVYTKVTKQQKSAAQKPQRPVITKLDAVLRADMESYLNNKSIELQKPLISDLFPKKGTIERLVREFKLEYPGPNKEDDIELIYNAIIKNPEIKKKITLANAVPVYRFLKETINEIWQKQDNEIWSR